MSAFHDNALIGASGSQGYQISRSVRLRSSASAYFNRTPASAGNRKTWTWSGWIKRGLISGSGTYEIFMGDNYSTSFTGIRFYNDAVLVQDYVSGSKNIFWQTNGLLRDPAAWYHVVVKYDTTQASSTNSVLIYVNGVSQALTFTANTGAYVQNYDGIVNSTNSHKIGILSTLGNYFDGYLTEVNFIDGQALTPSSFGETDTLTGVWKPKKYAGTYGTNGFYLNFSDNSSNTATTIGKDYSGNGNNWTPNNISVTSGSTYDSMLDVPTLWADGGNGRGNYATLSPIDPTPYGPVSGALSQGNLRFSDSTAAGYGAQATIKVSNGKWYWEVGYTSNSTGGSPYMAAFYCGASLVGVRSNAGLSNCTGTGFSYAVNDTLGVALDCDAGTFVVYKNGVSQGTFTVSVSVIEACPAIIESTSAAGTVSCNFNFGQRPFTYTPPSGFKALNTQNLPDSTIKKGNQYFDATTYTGTGSALTVTNSGSMQPDLVWIKNRTNALSHYLNDSVRGAYKTLFSNLTNAEYDGTSFSDGVSTFNSNGFTLLNGTNAANYNQSANNYVAWQWKAGGSSSSNTNGSITSTVSVNATAGFSVVTYTGTGANATVGHGLGVAPSMVIVKRRNSTGDWVVWNSTIAAVNASNVIFLNTTDAQTAVANNFNSTAPTSSVFSVGTNQATNASGGTHVAYCFSAVPGYSAFGSYTGNGNSSDGPFVYLGFRPRWLLLKVSSAAGYDWLLYDSSRDTYNVTNLNLRPDLSDAEGSQSANYLDFLSNGFKIRGTSSGSINPSQTIIYAAFAENPFKLSLAR